MLFIFYNLNIYSGKKKCANDLKFCTKISGLKPTSNGTFIWKKYFQCCHVKKPQWSGQGQFNLLDDLVQKVVLSKYEDNPFLNYKVVNYSKKSVKIQ
jgi:hypothetical protein